MFPLLRTLLLRGILTAAVLGIVITVFFLEEWPRRDLLAEMAARGERWPPEELWILVDLQRMALEVRNAEDTLLRYDIGYGRGALGRANAESAGTPLGEYRIIALERRAAPLERGARFLRIDYPGLEDADRGLAAGLLTREDYQRILDAHALGEAPPADTPLGGPLGIQGNLMAFVGRRFTDGSVAMDNGELIALAEILPIGTRVVITDH